MSLSGKIFLFNREKIYTVYSTDEIKFNEKYSTDIKKKNLPNYLFHIQYPTTVVQDIFILENWKGLKDWFWHNLFPQLILSTTYTE